MEKAPAPMPGDIDRPWPAPGLERLPQPMHQIPPIVVAAVDGRDPFAGCPALDQGLGTLGIDQVLTPVAFQDQDVGALGGQAHGFIGQQRMVTSRWSSQK